MSYVNRSIVTAAALAVGLSLSACSSGPDFDPTDYMPNNWFGGGKKPFPGERRPVFPGGVPGVAQGVPAEMIVGHKPVTDETPAADATTEPVKSAAQPAKPKPKKRTSAAQAQPAAAAPSRPAQSAASPWPDQATPAAPAQQNAWPPPNTNTFSR